MSIKKTERFGCPECKAEGDFVVWTSLNVTLDPQEKPRLMDATLTKFICAACGHAAQIIYPLLYHDMAAAYVLWLIPAMPDGKPSPIPEMPESVTRQFGAQYRSRVVDSHNQLREKILLFDAGLDDRVVEMAKVIVTAHWQKQHPSEKAEVFYCGSSNAAEGATMDFIVLTETGRHGVQVPREKWYAPLAAQFADILGVRLGLWARVDQGFALALLRTRAYVPPG